MNDGLIPRYTERTLPAAGGLEVYDEVQPEVDNRYYKSDPAAALGRENGYFPPQQAAWWKRKRWLALAAVVLVAVVVGVAVGVTVGGKKSSNSTPAETSNAEATTAPGSSSNETTAAAKKYPFATDTALAAAGSGKLFFQATSGEIIQRYQGEDTVLKPGLAPRSSTPLAVVEWDSRKQLQLFYLHYQDGNHLVADYIWANDAWSDGIMGTDSISARSESQLAALYFPEKEELRVYFQIPGSSLREVGKTVKGPGHWAVTPEADFLPRALAGSSLGAGSLGKDGPRLWYQAETDSNGLKEACRGVDNFQNWTSCEQFTSGSTIIPRSGGAIAGVTFTSGDYVNIKVVYQPADDPETIRDMSYVSARWSEKRPLMQGVLEKDGKIAVAVDDAGVGHAYYRATVGIMEMTFMTNNSDWNPGSRVVVPV